MSRSPTASRRTAPMSSGRRSEVLAAAAEQFAASGYAGSSLRQIADRAGILPGSLYHHFDSKEAIAVELVQAMAEAFDGVRQDGLQRGGDPLDDLRAFVVDGAAFFARHRAALALCIFDPPATSSTTLTELVRAQPAGLRSTIGTLIGRVERAGRLRAGIDQGLLRAALSHVTISSGLIAPDLPPSAMPEAFCDLVFHGLWQPRERVNAADARRVQRLLGDTARRWAYPEVPAGRRAEVLEAARVEFARRGFEATTMRDIAETAGFPVAGIYRHFASKNEIVTDIVGRFSHELLTATDQIIDATTDPVSALDGLCGLMNLAARSFRREYAIVQVWWRAASRKGTGGTDEATRGNRRRLQVLTSILSWGLQEGAFVSTTDIDLLALCVRELLWVPFEINTGRDDVPASLRALLRGGADVRRAVAR